jgi:hypothetical protein
MGDLRCDPGNGVTGKRSGSYWPGCGGSAGRSFWPRGVIRNFASGCRRRRARDGRYQGFAKECCVRSEVRRSVAEPWPVCSVTTMSTPRQGNRGPRPCEGCGATRFSGVGAFRASVRVGQRQEQPRKRLASTARSRPPTPHQPPRHRDPAPRRGKTYQPRASEGGCPQGPSDALGTAPQKPSGALKGRHKTHLRRKISFHVDGPALQSQFSGMPKPKTRIFRDSEVGTNNWENRV